jgi:hypothetical protein
VWLLKKNTPAGIFANLSSLATMCQPALRTFLTEREEFADHPEASGADDE